MLRCFHIVSGRTSVFAGMCRHIRGCSFTAVDDQTWL